VHDDLTEHRHDGSGWVVRSCRSSTETANEFTGASGGVALGVAVGEDVEFKTRLRHIFEEVGRCLLRGRYDVTRDVLNRPATAPRRSGPLFGRKTGLSLNHLETLTVDIFPDFRRFHDRSS
jgi:hypothetical protein